MAGGWSELREKERELALCLLFAREDMREWLADILLLALELEASSRLPSEPMLCAIRLQWWAEAVEGDASGESPLVDRLRLHIGAGVVTRAGLISIITLWQDRLADERITTGACWGSLFKFMTGAVLDARAASSSRATGARGGAGKVADGAGRTKGRVAGGAEQTKRKFTDSAGRAKGKAKGGAPADEAAVLADRIGRVFAGDHAMALERAEIAPLAGRELRWLWMIARLDIHRLEARDRDASGGGAGAHDGRGEPLLVWRMLGWRLFG